MGFSRRFNMKSPKLLSQPQPLQQSASFECCVSQIANSVPMGMVDLPDRKRSMAMSESCRNDKLLSVLVGLSTSNSRSPKSDSEPMGPSANDNEKEFEYRPSFAGLPVPVNEKESELRFVQKQSTETRCCADWCSTYNGLVLNILLFGSGIVLLAWAECSLHESWATSIGIMLFNAGFIPFCFFLLNFISDLFLLCKCGKRFPTEVDGKSTGASLIFVVLGSFLLAETQHDTVEDWAQMIGSRMIMVGFLFILQWFFIHKNEAQNQVGAAVAKTYFHSFIKPFCQNMNADTSFALERQIEGQNISTEYMLKSNKLTVLVPKELCSHNTRRALNGTRTAFGFPTNLKNMSCRTRSVFVLSIDDKNGLCSNMCDIPSELSTIYHQFQDNALCEEQIEHFQNTLFALIDTDSEVWNKVMILSIPEISGHIPAIHEAIEKQQRLLRGLLK